MSRFARTLTISCAALACAFNLVSSPTFAVQPHPCTSAQQRAIMRVISRFSRALIRNDMTTVNHLITPALRAATHSYWVQRYAHSKTEQAALSVMLVGPDYNGTPARPISFRFLPDRLDCYGAKPLTAGTEIFYRWPGEALSVVNLVQTTQGWRISGLGLAQV
jgi:hypothetical protein